MRFIPLGRFGDGETPQGSALALPTAAMTISPQLASRIRPDLLRVGAQLRPQDAATTERCACLVGTVPEIAADPAMTQQGMQLCLQDAAGFEQQLVAAGYSPSCGDGAMPWYRTTVGMVGIGAGVLAVLGGAFLVLR